MSWKMGEERKGEERSGSSSWGGEIAEMVALQCPRMSREAGRGLLEESCELRNVRIRKRIESVEALSFKA